MTRRQVLKSLCAAAMAAVAPITAMGAAEPSRIKFRTDGKIVLPPGPLLIDPDAPCRCCCDEAIESYKLTIYTLPGRTYDLPLLPDGSYGGVFEDLGEIRVTGIREAFEIFKSRTDFEGVSLCTPYRGEVIRVGE